MWISRSAYCSFVCSFFVCFFPFFSFFFFRFFLFFFFFSDYGFNGTHTRVEQWERRGVCEWGGGGGEWERERLMSGMEGGEGETERGGGGGREWEGDRGIVKIISDSNRRPLDPEISVLHLLLSLFRVDWYLWCSRRTWKKCLFHVQMFLGGSAVPNKASRERQTDRQRQRHWQSETDR